MSTPPLHRVGFREGLRWLPTGAELLARHLRPLLGVASLWLLISLLASLVPGLGQIILMVLTPLLTAGLLSAFDRARAGAEVRPGQLFAPWQDPNRRKTLVGLGFISLAGTFFAAMAFAAWLSAQVDPAALEASLDDPEALAELLRGASLGGGIVLAALIFLAVVAGLFFAVPMAQFGRIGALESLRYSYRAVLSSLPAMIALLLTIVGFALALGFVTLLVVSLVTLALGPAGQFIGQLVLVAATLFVQVVLSGTQYVAFCAVSGWTPGPDDPTGSDDEILA
ncbi:hypothetical protein AY599_01740 [Leptolyngbya valderiana BDU 20041]|nr:hypothetical protein AY599_01740 [Leptolyngbya valderiana BDU 20041]